jgi:hypothetical protein
MCTKRNFTFQSFSTCFSTQLDVHCHSCTQTCHNSQHLIVVTVHITSGHAVHNRPRHRVRARPLSETSPELGVYMSSLAHTSSSAAIEHYSSAHQRGTADADCIGYDELMLLVRRFKAHSSSNTNQENISMKGRVQYGGKLLSLLDVPSLTALEKRLVAG